jgi:hypothetical protein
MEFAMETPVAYGAAAKIRPECLRAFADGWEQPTAAEVRAVIQTTGLTGSQVSKLVGIAEGRTVRRWTGGESPIPFSAWAILCHVAGYGIIWSAPSRPMPTDASAQLEPTEKPSKSIA